jgi:hypothetical protein
MDNRGGKFRQLGGFGRPHDQFLRSSGDRDPLSKKCLRESIAREYLNHVETP